jgi:hypothetical protein
MYVFTGEYLLMVLDLASIHKRWGFFFIIVKDGDVACLSSEKRMPAGCRIIYCRPLLLELTSSEPLTLDKEVGAHAGGVASRQEEVRPRHTRARSPPPRSRYRQRRPAFHRRRVTITHSIAVASPSHL